MSVLSKRKYVKGKLTRCIVTTLIMFLCTIVPFIFIMMSEDPLVINIIKMVIPLCADVYMVRDLVKVYKEYKEVLEERDKSLIYFPVAKDIDRYYNATVNSQIVPYKGFDLDLKNIEIFLKYYNMIYTEFVYLTNHNFQNYDTMLLNLFFIRDLDYLFVKESIFLKYVRRKHKKLIQLYKLYFYKNYKDQIYSRYCFGAGRILNQFVPNPNNRALPYFALSGLSSYVIKKGKDNYNLIPNGDCNETFLTSEFHGGLENIHNISYIMYIMQNRVFEEFNKYLTKKVKRRKINVPIR